VDELSGPATVIATLAVVIAAWWPVRAFVAHRVERAFAAKYPRNAEGYIIGAEPMTLNGTRRGAVLVLHGYNDSPQAMRSVAEALNAAGWTVRVPALPGHARSLREFADARASDWERASRDELDALLRQHDAVAVCGMSMGGALALLLAAENRSVRAVVALAPYLHLSRPMTLLLALGPVAAIGARYLTGGGKRSVHDPAAAAAIVAYRASTPRLLYELTTVTRHAYDALHRVTQPVLLMQSREDNRIPQRSAEAAFAEIGSADKSLEWLTGRGHVITVDYGHADLERRIVAWLKERMPSGAAD
jgi:carboxylesterase